MIASIYVSINALKEKLLHMHFMSKALKNTCTVWPNRICIIGIDS